jgi:hypothetical protein
MIDAVMIAMAGFVPSGGGKYWADIVEEEPTPMYVKYVNIATMTCAYTKALVIPGIGVFSRNPFTGRTTKMMYTE